MTVAAAATKAIAGRASGPRLATPGAVLLLAGLALLYWGLGVFRGEAGGAFGSGPTRRFTGEPMGHKDDGHEHGSHTHTHAGSRTTPATRPERT